jgi:hypothetical protein
MKEINFFCSKCDEGIELTDPFPSEISCGDCGQKVKLVLSGVNPLKNCCVCEGDAFYMQKDFNRRVGLLLVVLGALLSLILFAIGCTPLQFFLPLVVLPLFDFFIYWICPNILICYRCECIYRQFEADSSAEGFQLARSSKLKIRRS